MQLVTVGLHTPLRIPASWDRFSYRGWLYVRGEAGRFVIWGPLGTLEKSA